MSTAPTHLTETRAPGATFIVRAALCLLIIGSGLALRRFGPALGLAFPLVKYGGSILWGTMLFFLVAMAARGQSRQRIALISAAIAVCVELFRLVHAPWLDDFRLTTAGALLLGRVFSPWNMLAYCVGIGLGMGLDCLGMSGLTSARLSARAAPHSPS